MPLRIKTVSDLRKAARTQYAWPGGYPTFFVCDDGGALCHECARCRDVIEAVARKLNNGWRVVALDINWEDASLYCDHCHERIQSAYAED